VATLGLLFLLALPSGDKVDFGTTTAQRVRLLRHRRPAVRRRAALLLAHADPDEALAGLIVALHDPSTGVREAAAASLGSLGDERAAPFLAYRSREERVPRVLARILVALARCGGTYVARGVLPFLEHPAREVRVAAAAALGHVGDAGQRDALWSALRFAPDDPRFAVRASILAAFANLGWTEDVRRAVKELEEMGARRHWMARAEILDAIGRAGLEERLDYVRRELREPEDPRVVAAAAGALARMGRVDEVAALLGAKAPIVRRAALSALQEANDPRAVRAARDLVGTDPDTDVRFEAALLLDRAGDPLADGYLVDALRSRNPTYWIEALGALERKYGRSFGRDPDAWTRFLDRRRKGG